jgi:predicted transposase YdaD
MPKYDITLKRLTDSFAADYVRFALGIQRFAMEVLDVEKVDKELPMLLREVDFAAKIKVEEEFVLLMEFQTVWREDLPERMLGYTWRLFEKYRLPVNPFLILLREGGKPRGSLETKVLGRRVFHFDFTVIPVWEMEAKEVVNEKLAGLYPLLPLMKWGEPVGRVLERVQELITAEVEERERRADAYVALKVLSGIKYPIEVVEKILRRRDIMIESPVYEQILKEGREEGREKGREEGRRESLKNDILAVLEVRFQIVPHVIEQDIQGIDGLRQLGILHKKAVVVNDVDEFRQFLERIKAS